MSVQSPRLHIATILMSMQSPRLHIATVLMSMQSLRLYIASILISLQSLRLRITTILMSVQSLHVCIATNFMSMQSPRLHIAKSSMPFRASTFAPLLSQKIKRRTLKHATKLCALIITSIFRMWNGTAAHSSLMNQPPELPVRIKWVFSKTCNLIFFHILHIQ